MSHKSDYTNEEWNKLLRLVAGIVWHIEMKQTEANDWEIKKLAGTAQALAGNSAGIDLMVDLSKDVKSYVFDALSNPSDVKAFKSPGFVEAAIKDCSHILREKATHREVSEFKDFVYKIAFRLADNSGDGYPGFGRKVDAGEAEFLLVLKSELSGI